MKTVVDAFHGMFMRSLMTPPDVYKETINSNRVPGTISIGDTPAQIDPQKPVVVFVQGLTNDSSLWYVENDMYNRAYHAGFQTAFVELYDSGGEPQSYWDNGAMLAGQLDSISSYFQGRKIVIVAFSKGALDAQVALIHEGKHSLVSNIISLGTPYYGSELADMANSSSLDWLAELIGHKSEGTQSLQTGVMNHFRSFTDSKWEASQNRYLTLAGNRAGPIFSIYWFGGGFITGPSDGVVAVSSSRLLYGINLGVGNWNHGEVNKGTHTFQYFKPYLTQQQVSVTPIFNRQAESPAEPALDVFVRGGKQYGTAFEVFYVENETNGLVINWLSSSPHNMIEITRPGQLTPEIFQVTPVQDDTTFFKGAWHHIIQVDHPEAGQWTVKTVSSGSTAYAIMVRFDSSLNNQLAFVAEQDKKHWDLKTNFGAAAAKERATVEVFAKIRFTPGNRKDHQFRQLSRDFNQNGGTSVLLPDEEGTYNMTVEVEGVTPSGQLFQRTVVKSVYVDEKGTAY